MKIFTRLLLSIIALAALIAPIGSQTSRTRATADVFFNVATTGIDAGDCIATPCRTGQYAYARVMNDWDFAGFSPYIKYAPGSAEGSYVGGIKLTGVPVGAYLVYVVGQQNNDVAQSCSQGQAQQVVIDGTAGNVIFDAQDLAIGVFRCLTVRAKCNNPCTQRDSGVIAFNARQTPASDIAHVIFDALPAGIGVRTESGGEINLGGNIWIGNNMQSFIFGSGRRVTVAAPITFLNPVNVDWFARSYGAGSLVEFAPPTSIVNPSYMNGSQYLVYKGGALDTGGLTLPGSAGGNVGNTGFVY